MSTGGPSDPVRRTRIRWGTGGGAVGLVVGVIGGLLVGGNLTVLGVGAVGAVAAVATVVFTASGQVMAHSDRRHTRSREERDRLERAESRARARAEVHQHVRAAAAAVVLEAFGGGGLTDNVFVQCDRVRFQLTNGSRLPISGINVAIPDGGGVEDGAPGGSGRLRWGRRVHRAGRPPVRRAASATSSASAAASSSAFAAA